MRLPDEVLAVALLERHVVAQHLERDGLAAVWTCARVLCQDEGATLADIREAVTMLEDAARTCRRVLGGAHPTTEGVEDSLREAQTALHSSEAPPSETDTP